MRRFFFCLWQWLWGFPQNLLGAILFLVHRNCPHDHFHDCIVTYWNQRGSMGLGMFLFIDPSQAQQDPHVLIHEFGHSVQSLILGPLFLPVMGIPSYLWCNLPPCRRIRKEKNISYYWFYPESTANWLGAWAHNRMN